MVDGRLYGRGATDMKGGLAAAMWATRVAVEHGLRPRGDVVFHVVSDEEVVGNGTREIVERSPACDVTISLEPSELRLCAAEGGLVHFRIEVEGEEAHASTRYLSLYAGGKAGGGVNAIEKTLKLVVALQELERQWANAKSHPILPPGFDTLSPGIIVGGPGGGADGRLNLFSNAGTAPNYCSVEYNMWWYPDESYEDVRAEVEDVVAAVASTDPWLREHPPKLTWKLGIIYFPPLDVPLDHPAVGTLAGCLREVGLDPSPQGFGAATDLAWYGERKLPGIICGPGRLAQCHVADEYLDTEQLLARGEGVRADARRLVPVAGRGDACPRLHAGANARRPRRGDAGPGRGRSPDPRGACRDLRQRRPGRRDEEPAQGAAADHGSRAGRRGDAAAAPGPRRSSAAAWR